MWILKQYHFHYSNSCEQYEIVTKFGARNFFILPIWYKRAESLKCAQKNILMYSLLISKWSVKWRPKRPTFFQLLAAYGTCVIMQFIQAVHNINWIFYVTIISH